MNEQSKYPATTPIAGIPASSIDNPEDPIAEFQGVYLAVYGQDITREQAQDYSTRLLAVYRFALGQTSENSGLQPGKRAREEPG